MKLSPLPMQEVVTLRVLQWPLSLTEVVVHQDRDDGGAIDRADGGDRREGGGDLMVASHAAMQLQQQPDARRLLASEANS